ncbi:MAG TPA: FlgD immunoglobulin-like domain containing protein, partial [Spirochaetales bacterium]|nr:FlgD immunoglobulin-like domain containing protein [Spirochaetales bacterium]
QTVTGGTQTYVGSLGNFGTLTGVGLVTLASITTPGVGARTVNVGTGGLSVSGAADFSGGTVNGAAGGDPNWDFQGNLTFSAASTVNPAGDILRFSAGNAQTFTTGGLVSFGPISVAKTAATAVTTSGSLTAASLAVGSGIFTVGVGSTTTITGGVTVTERLRLANTGNLTVGTSLTVGGVLDFVNASTVTVAGNLDFGATGTTNNPANSSFDLNGAAAQVLTPNAQTFGAVSMTGTGGVSMVGTATFGSLSVSVGETFTLGGATATNLTVTGALANAGTLTFRSTAAVPAVLSLGLNSSNSGTFNLGASNAAGMATLSMANGRTLNNTGGTLQVVSSAGAVSIVSPGTMTLSGNQLDLNALTLHVSGFSTAVAHTLDPSDILILDGTATFSGGLTLDGAGALVDVGVQTLNVSGGTGFTLTDGDAQVTTGTINATSGLTITNGSVTATTGRINTGASALNLAAGGSIAFTGAGAPSLSAGPVTNAGIITLAGGTASTGSVTNTGTITFDTAAGATWTAAGFVTSSGAINNTFSNTISTNGNVTISGTFATPLNSTLRMTGSPTNLNATIPLGNFIANAGGTITIAANLGLANDLTIQTGTLASGNFTITIAGNWTNATGVITAFTPGTGIVEFTDSALATVSGPNQWYNLRYNQPGGRIRFQRSNIQRIVAGGTFQAIGTIANHVTITRDDLGDDGADLNWLTGVPPNPVLMWQLDKTGTGNLDFQYVDVWYSDARSNPIAYNSLYVTLRTVVPDGAPPLEQGLTCYAWFSGMTVVYSYTEDSDDDGRIDRIRVTAQGALNMDFSDLEITVTGYEIDTTVYPSGFSGTVGDADFYIHLVEKPYLDSSRTPSWTMTNNTALKSNAAFPNDYTLVLNLADPMIPADTVPPRIAYTLAVPSTPDVFFAFNERVERAGGGVLTAAEIPGSVSVSLPGLIGDGDVYGVLAAYGGNFSIANIVGELARTVNAGITDQAVPLYDWSTDPVASAYITTVPDYPAGSLPNPISLTSNTHRVSDLLVSVPPSDTVGAWSYSGGANADSFFVWPLWAKDEAYVPGVPDVDYPTIPELDASGQYVGFVRLFDGSRFLRDQDFDLQVEDALGLGSAPQILYKSDVSAAYLSAVPGIWLPTYAEPDFSGLASYPFTGFVSNLTGTGTTPIWDYSFLASDPEIYDRARFEFYFRLPGPYPADLYAGRLDMDPDATAIPADWYRRVRPFGILIRNVVTQKGGVSILNNVIDPTTGERTRLHYTIGQAGPVTITVFTLDGDVVRSLQRGTMTPGDYTASWDGRNRAGDPVARGMYFIRIVAPGIDEIRKVMVVRY